MKGDNNYIPVVGERVLISAPNMDDENGYVYGEFDVLEIDEISITYGNKGFHSNLNLLNHVSIKKLDGVK